MQINITQANVHDKLNFKEIFKQVKFHYSNYASRSAVDTAAMIYIHLCVISDYADEPLKLI